MSNRRPRIEYYWTRHKAAGERKWTPQVNWRLVGANGEVICYSNQGFRDATDARRSVSTTMSLFVAFNNAYGIEGSGTSDPNVPEEVGPGKRPVGWETP